MEEQCPVKALVVGSSPTLGAKEKIMAWPKTVRKTDLKIDFFRAGGPGGQNQNKRDSACRRTHIPTGLSSESREYREQLKNKEAAFLKLTKKLVPLMKAALSNSVEIERITERIRTYHSIRGEVKDHRTGKIAPLDKVLDGEIDLLS